LGQPQTRWLAGPSLIRLSLAFVLFNSTSSLFMQCHLFFGLAFLLIQTTAQGSMPTNSLSLPIGISTDTQNSNIPPCVLQCLTQSAQVAGCETYVWIDFWGLTVAWTPVVIYRMSKTCACTSASFQQAGRTCLQSNCSSLDQASAALLQENQCTTGTWLILSFISWFLMRTIIAPASSTASSTSQIVPISTTLPNDALTVGYAIGNVGWVAVAGALSIIVAF